MNSENQIKDSLQIWQQIYSDRMKTGELDPSHIPDETLYAIAGDNGIEKAEPETAEHLSLCPICMERWASWREAISMVEGGESEADLIMTYGTLKIKAAASEKPFEPITSTSSCGRFTLGLLPQVDDPEKGLVTLDVVRKDDMSFENRQVEVRDNGGFVFLQGTIHQGRLARRCENLADIDLSGWTVIEKE